MKTDHHFPRYTEYIIYIYRNYELSLCVSVCICVSLVIFVGEVNFFSVNEVHPQYRCPPSFILLSALFYRYPPSASISALFIDVSPLSSISGLIYRCPASVFGDRPLSWNKTLHKAICRLMKVFSRWLNRIKKELGLRIHPLYIHTVNDLNGL